MDTAAPAGTTGFDLEVKHRGRKSPRANSRPLALEIRGLVDVVHGPGVVDLEQLHPFGVLLDELARAIVSVQRRQLVEKPPGETHRMPAFAAIHRSRDRRALRDGLGNDANRFGPQERHVSKRDHPAISLRSGAYACRKAGAHALCRVLANDSAASGIAQDPGELLCAWPDDRDRFG